MQTVSVVLSVYNEEKNLPEAIESILRQSYKDVELICCDDKSTDRSLSILREYEKKYPCKIKVIENRENRGQAYARNRCIERARGQFIAVMDSDDLCSDLRLEKQVAFLKSNASISFVGTGMTYFDEQGTWATKLMEEYPSREMYVPHAPFCLASCMFRKEVLVAVGGYNESPIYRSGEDYELVVSLLEKGYKGANICEPLYYCREDAEVYKEVSTKERFMEALKTADVVRRLNLPRRYYLYVFRPLILALLPGKVYMKIHRDTLRRGSYEKGR